MLYPRRRCPDLVKVFVAGPVSKAITCPIFTKLVWMIHLDLLMDLKDLDAESGLRLLDQVKVFVAGAL